MCSIANCLACCEPHAMQPGSCLQAVTMGHAASVTGRPAPGGESRGSCTQHETELSAAALLNNPVQHGLCRLAALKPRVLQSIRARQQPSLHPLPAPALRCRTQHEVRCQHCWLCVCFLLLQWRPYPVRQTMSHCPAEGSESSSIMHMITLRVTALCQVPTVCCRCWCQLRHHCCGSGGRNRPVCPLSCTGQMQHAFDWSWAQL